MEKSLGKPEIDDMNTKKVILKNKKLCILVPCDLLDQFTGVRGVELHAEVQGNRRHAFNKKKTF